MILVFGTICLDRVRGIASLPQPGGYVGVQSEEVFLGGEAANTATALRAWGADLALYGNLLGEGEDAHLLLRKVVEKGLPTDHLKLGSGITPVCDIYVTPNGERTMFGLGFEQIQEGVDPHEIRYPAHGWFTGDMNLGAIVREAAQLAREAGMRVYLMDLVENEEMLSPSDFWQSSTDWVGVRGHVQKNVQWVRAHVQKYGCFTILSDGPNGLVAGGPGHPARHYPPFPDKGYVDSTGAGDMFRAGMLFGLHEGWDVGRCLAYASAAGCLKCQYLGATTHVPSREEIEAHMAEHADVAARYTQA